ncbi:MAG: hypothetical protein EOM37_01305 [Proteobacteria bacterium]|nr:hypothetical protein [Pseudomonadota bacterium]
MIQKLKRFSWRFYLVIILAIAILGYFAVPWRPVIQNKIKSVLASHGLQEASFTINDIGFKSALIENIKLGPDNPLSLSKARLYYSLPELMTGKLKSLELEGLDLKIRQDNGIWKIGGIEGWQASSSSDRPFLLPVSANALQALPVQAFRVEGGRFQADSDNLHMKALFSLSWSNGTQAVLSVKSEGISFKSGSVSGITGAASLEAKANPQTSRWEGNWTLPSVKLTGIKDNLPLLDGTGTVMAYADRIESRGSFASKEKAYHLSFAMTSDLVSPTNSKQTILETSMPWMQGSLMAKEINIPLGGGKPLHVDLNLQKVSIAALLQYLTGQDAVATGTVSGTLPISLSEKGALSVQDVALQSNEPGTIKMPPESIPGDNPQVAFVREVLGDFYYSNLLAKIENTQDKKLSVILIVEGKNPNVQGGRPVKINVHLKGDLLAFIEQNLLWLYDPIKLMERGKHEIN